MAVVQISRIQVRRGKSLAGTGLPQLASGELAWSLDTQELYIGNGSVAEGSPAVGNTKILTERDLTVQGNLLALIQHIYKTDNPSIQTGPSPNDPISRRTQDRLDDRVTVADFGTIANGTINDTAALQRAINQLFLNTTKSSGTTADAKKTRVILELAPGVYKTTDTLYIPSYATLVGSGSDKTIIEYTGSGPAIQFINDDSVIGNPSPIGNTKAGTQPRHIILKGFTVHANTTDQTALQLDAVKNSYFDDLVIKGEWSGAYHANSIGIKMNAVSALVTCSDNVFNNVSISGFSYAVYSKQDIKDNTFTGNSVTDCRQGFVLGLDADGSTVGEQYGPRQTQIIGCKFDNVKRHAVYVGRGTGNTTRDCKLTNVGNNGSGVFFPEYPQIYFGSVGNTSQSDQSDREEFLSSMSFTVDLELSAPVSTSISNAPGDPIPNALRGATITQNTTNVQGTLKEDYDSATNITVVTRNTSPFNNLNNLVINNNISPGDITTFIITDSSTTEFVTDDTAQLSIGSRIKFNGTQGGVVANTWYWVQNISDSQHFSISESLGGARKSLTVSSNGTMVGTYNATVHPITVGDISMVPYIPEIAGYVTYSSYATRQVSLGYITSPSLVCILPLSTGPSGNPSRSVSYKIDYTYKSNVFNFTRRGILSLVVDVDASITLSATKSQLSDDYNITGTNEVNSLAMDFSVALINATGAVYTGSGDEPYAIALRYINTLSLGTNTISGKIGTISAAGTSGNFYQTTVTGLNTTGLLAGQVLAETGTNVGSFGTDAVIYSVDGGTQITIRASSPHTAGSITFSATTLSSDSGIFTYSYTAVL